MSTPATAAITALVLVDLQQWIVSLDLAPLSGGEVAEHGAALRRRFREAGRPTVLVRYLRLDGSDGGADGPAASFVAELAPQPEDHVVTKYGLDAFEGTDLDEHLRQAGVDTVVIAGIATAHGVAATARGALARGYTAIVVTGATTSLSAAEHTRAIAELDRLGVGLRDAADAVTLP